MSSVPSTTPGSAAFIRAASPLFAGISATLAQGQTEAVGRIHADFGLQGASSVDDVIAMIPGDYRTELRPFILEVADNATKRCAAQTVLTRWSLLKAAGRYPSHLTVKSPEVQLSKGFAQESEARDAKAALAEAHKTYLDSAFAACTDAKTKELAFLEGLLTTESFYTNWAGVVRARGDALKLSHKDPVLDQDEATGELHLSGWQANAVTATLAARMLSTFVLFGLRTMSIVEARERALADKRFKKKEIATAAMDVEMGDATTSSTSAISTMVDKALDAKLKKLGPKIKVSSGFVRFKPYPLTSPTGRRQGQGQQGGGVQKDQVVHIQEGQRPRQGWGEQEEAFFFFPLEEFESDDEGQGERKGRKEVDRTINYADPSTYPDAWLSMPLPKAISLLRLHIPLDLLSAAQFKQRVHCSPGVSLPEEIELNLSIGMRFMSLQSRNKKLIRLSWMDFQRRLRWRLKFTFEDENTYYDPDYDVSIPKKDAMQPLPQYLELGLVKGRKFVNSTISNIPDETVWDDFVAKSLKPNFRRIEKFLVDNDYVVTATDKNLGLAVSKRTWIVEKCLEILNSKSDYKPLTKREVKIILDRKCAEMGRLADECEIYLPFEGSLDKFLRCKITAQGDEHVIPQFYGIPKIHKVPTKMRPIIPCHSAVMNPAAKFISKKLKPLIREAPTIIHGTKDLAQKFSKLNLQHGRRYFIVTGDVVAFYPNIPLKSCLDIVSELYADWYWLNTLISKPEDMERHLKILKIFNELLWVGNTQLVTQFQDQLFEQLRGIAMGVADSPDLANLYGWYFERKYKVMSHPLIPFYGRYIDDCFGIVYAQSEQEAISTISSVVKFDGCTIEWNASEHFQVFLDMCVYKDYDGSLQHMPYRKDKNHQERVPWISHHPLDVKRGTFIGEMSRLATLSSKKSHYTDSMKGLVTLYVKRGYPVELVQTWLKNNYQERWNKRLDTREVPSQLETPLVLKTEFNTAWNYFNATELKNIIFGYWREWLDRADRGQFNLEFPAPRDEDQGYFDTAQRFTVAVKPFAGHDRQDDAEAILVPDIRKIGILNRRLITSRKRTRNLFDLTSFWKKTVLEKLDDLVSEQMSTDLIHPGGIESLVQSTQQMELESDDDGDIIMHQRDRRSPLGWAH
jgi:hypothetical protein